MDLTTGDLVTVQQRVGIIEAALTHGTVSADERTRLLRIHELDRLAESLVGDQATEAQEVKNRIQQLLIRADPPGPDAMVYLEVYCHAFRG